MLFFNLDLSSNTQYENKCRRRETKKVIDLKIMLIAQSVLAVSLFWRRILQKTAFIINLYTLANNSQTMILALLDFQPLILV